jgi:hypothetical protein
MSIHTDAVKAIAELINNVVTVSALLSFHDRERIASDQLGFQFQSVTCIGG